MCPEARIDCRTARENGERIRLAAIQAQPFDGDLPTLDAIAGEMALIEHGGAGGQRRLRGVNEPTAIAGDASRVGGNDLGRFAGDFNPAVQVTGMRAVDFVEDDAGATRGQPRIAVDPAAELGGCVRATVVQNRALVVDIELAVTIARNTSGSGRLDMDEGNAVPCLMNRRTLIDGSVRIGANLCGHMATEQRTLNQAGQAKVDSHRP